MRTKGPGIGFCQDMSNKITKRTTYFVGSPKDVKGFLFWLAKMGCGEGAYNTMILVQSICVNENKFKPLLRRIDRKNWMIDVDSYWSNKDALRLIIKFDVVHLVLKNLMCEDLANIIILFC